jgi:hypothetical protein
MVVVRKGTGPLHIASPEQGRYETICDKTLTGTGVLTWKAGRTAVAVWNQWRHCPTCEHLDRMWR